MELSNEPELNLAIGERLRDLREGAKLTQEQVSAQLNVGRQAYSLYEIGMRALPVPVAIRVSDRFNVTLDWLLAGNARTSRQSPGNTEA